MARDRGDERTVDELARRLTQLDGQSYGRYKSLQGDWTADGYTVTVRKAQTDPFAPAK